MPTEIKLPVLGENVDSGTVVKVLVSVGDTVTEDQPVLDLDTEKASVEVPSSASGTVKEIRVKEGDTVKVGQVLLTLEEAATAQTKEANPEPAPEEAPQKPEAEEPLQETAEAQEEVQEQEKPESVPPAAAVHDRPGAHKAPAQKRQPEVVRFPKQEPEPSRELVPAAPNVRRMARELGIDISEVTGTGRDSHISEEDVRNYARSIILNSTARQTAVKRGALGVIELPDFARWGEIERKPMS